MVSHCLIGKATLHRSVHGVHFLIHHFVLVQTHSWWHVLVVVVAVVHRRVERVPLLRLGVRMLLCGYKLTFLIFIGVLQIFRNGSLDLKLVTIVIDSFLVYQVHSIIFAIECDVTETCLFLFEHEVDLGDCTECREVSVHFRFGGISWNTTNEYLTDGFF